MRFETRTRSKSVGDRNLIRNFFRRRALLASGLEGSKGQEASIFHTVTFVPENPDEV